MGNIFNLSVYEVLHIFRFLDTQDRIAFALTCQRFRRLCVDERVFRKVDLSACPVGKTQRGAMSKFIRDKEIVQQITELNISNVRFLNWQIDDQLEQFIMSICPHLEALHVVNCGMSSQKLQHILKKAPRLAFLSWSFLDFTSEDIEFLSKAMKSPEGICLKNIKHLHLETFPSKSHIQIMKYLVCYNCKDLEELKIRVWQIKEDYTALSFRLPAYQMNSVASIEDKLQNLHSVTVAAVGTPSALSDLYREDLYDFISSVVRKKSRETKWRKLWISPPIGILNLHDPIPLDSLLPLREIQPDELQSIEEITAHAYWSFHEVNKLKILFQRIPKNTVKRFHLCQPLSEANSIIELCEPISRFGGPGLKFLSLSFGSLVEMPGEINTVFHTLFSDCLNIVEDLFECFFEKDICEPLSNLRHLTKVQLTQCAISSKYNSEDQVEISKANLLTFVQNCKNITHLHVDSCLTHGYFSCCLTDGDLLALAKLTNLKSLTLDNISGIRKWTFLKSIFENCKFLTMLRISHTRLIINNSHIPILMESAKFLKHLALHISGEVDLQSEDFWNLLSQAKNLERLCIRSYDTGLINVPVAVETLKSLPQLQVLHLHTFSKENVEVFHNQIKTMLEEENSDRSSSFELVTEYDFKNMPMNRKRHVFNKALPLNVVELCYMSPIVSVLSF